MGCGKDVNGRICTKYCACHAKKQRPRSGELEEMRSQKTKNHYNTPKIYVFDDFVIDMVVSQNTKNDDSTTKMDVFL